MHYTFIRWCNKRDKQQNEKDLMYMDKDNILQDI